MSHPVLIDGRSVTVRVPASTSNLGAGFDTLGLALQIHNEVTIAPAPRGMVEPAFGNSAGSAVTVAGAIDAFCERTGVEPPGLFFEAKGDVPWSRGLGSSATLIAGVLAGLNELCGAGLDKMDLVRLCAREEGHPDNAMAAVLGGFCVARRDPETNALRDVIRVDVRPELKFVVVAPELEFSTKQSRGLLPERIAHLDASKSANSAAFLTAAFATGDYAKLRGAVGDFLHEPYRLPKIPGAAAAIAAGLGAGALTGWLSGSGSSVLCVCDEAQAAAVGAAMAAEFAAVGVPSRIFPVAADNRGLQVTDRRP
jgi:homoserine kinase